MLIEEIIALLLANDPLAQLVGTNVFDTAFPRQSPLPSPAIVCRIVSSRPTYTSDGPTKQNATVVQFDIHGTKEEVRGVRDELAALLQDYRGDLSAGSRVQSTIWEMDADESYEHSMSPTAVTYHIMCQARFVWLTN